MDRRRLLLWLPTIIVALAVSAGGAVYSITVSQVQDSADSSLRTLGLYLSQTIHQYVKHSREKVRLTSSRTQLRKLLHKYETDPNPRHLLAVKRILKDAQSATSDFVQLDIHDVTGNILVSTHDAAQPLHDAQITFANLLDADTVSFNHYKMYKDGPLHQLSVALMWDQLIVGYLTVHTRMKDLYAYLSAEREHLADSAVLLVDAKMNNQKAMILNLTESNRDLASKLDSIDIENTNILQTDSSDGVRCYLMSQKLNANNWYLVIAKKESDVIKKLESLQVTYLWILMLSVMGALAITFLVLA